MKVIAEETRFPIYLWLDDIEDGAMAQAKNLAELPFILHHVAIMPDSHQGYGMPIGGVIATKGVVIPNAVGVDIGCGMCAVRTSLTYLDIDVLKEIVGEIRNAIPLGFNKHQEMQDEALMPKLDFGSVIPEQYNNARKSLGTLGGGNHFIEIQKDEDGHIWIMIHSGSRNLGKTVADHHNKIAVKLNEQYFSQIPKKHELAFLPLDSVEGKDYIMDMNYCVEFALANRKHMMNAVIDIFKSKELGAEFDEIINIAHNYAKMEHHYGKDVMVHRKGATYAGAGNIGIIPGSQGSKSYIVRGLGNHESFNSCSHGAGRKMGRKDAERRLDLEAEVAALDAMGVLHGVRGIHQLDEAPGAYKDIEVVMENQKDLVEIVHTLTPLAVVKG